MDGTVAENISRYGEHDSPAIVEAAKLAGAHEFILALPNGYDTRHRRARQAAVGRPTPARRRWRARFSATPKSSCSTNPTPISTRWARPICAARSSNSRSRAARSSSSRIGRAFLPAVDKLAVMKAGQIVSFGPRDEVLAALNKAATQLDRRKRCGAIQRDKSRGPPCNKLNPAPGAPNWPDKIAEVSTNTTRAIARRLLP